MDDVSRAPGGYIGDVFGWRSAYGVRYALPWDIVDALAEVWNNTVGVEKEWPAAPYRFGLEGGCVLEAREVRGSVRLTLRKPHGEVVAVARVQRV